MSTTTFAPFTDAVSERAGAPLDLVGNILDKHGVEEAPSPPPVKSLRVESVAFRGMKTIQGQTTPFEFAWKTGEAGIWALVSEGNLVGKTTVLQVVLWALRGAPKSLSGTVRPWIHHVTVEFLVDGKKVLTDFDATEGKVAGTVSIGEPDHANFIQTRFDSDDQFKRCMQGLMLEMLSLEKIPGSQKIGDRIVPYDDGWLAYTGAFLTDSESDAIIGQNIPGTNFVQRLLQVYIGLPWAQTLFKARSRARVLEGENASRKKQLAALKGRSVEAINQQIAEIDALMSQEAAGNEIAERLQAEQRIYDDLAAKMRSASVNADALLTDLEAARSAQVRASKLVRTLEDSQAATNAFAKLKPTCCPRCAVAIDEGRVEAEAESLECSVCTRRLPEPDEADIKAEIDDAKLREKEAKADYKSAKKLKEDFDAQQVFAAAEFKASGARLSHLAALGTAADIVTLSRKKERLEGMLEVAQDIESTILIDADELGILGAAADEAQARVEGAAGALMRDVSEEILRIIRRLGMTDAERVELQRSARVNVEKGGTVVGWGNLTVGEQLRLRIATVIALVRGAKGKNMGRHPGLLMIDSPSSEEVADEVLQQMIEELQALCEEVPNLQLFIAMGGKSHDPFGTSERVLRCKAGDNMW